MSELNQLIASWRQSLADLEPLKIDELEDHLRSEIAALKTRQLADAEAFAVATMRCGRPTDLLREFSKTNGAAAWSTRLRWMVVGALACGLLTLMLGQVNVILGIALVHGGVGVAIAVALRYFSITVFMSIFFAIWFPWIRRRASLLEMDPPRWLTSGRGLMLAICLMPWLFVAVRLLDAVVYQLMPPEQLVSLIRGDQYVYLLMPYIGPMMLMIIAIGLSRSQGRSATLSSGNEGH
jgi:hypothetical protein